MNLARLIFRLFHCRRSYLKTCAANGAFIWFFNVGVLRGDQLLWHTVRLDNQGELLSWVNSDAPYDKILKADWTMFESISVQSNGYRTYFTYPEFNGTNDPAQPLFAG